MYRVSIKSGYMSKKTFFETKFYSMLMLINDIFNMISIIFDA